MWVNKLVERKELHPKYNVHLTLSPFKPCQIRADVQRLKQVIANLLSNVCKYSPKNKEVKIKVVHDNKSVSISVIDYGLGIPEQFKDKVFEKFTQADTGNTRQASGTGLGLSIAKKIVELHQGSISFISAPATGTVFTVKLPLL